jgi:hypothetical protein
MAKISSKPYQLHYIIGAKYDTVDEGNSSVVLNAFKKNNFIRLFYTNKVLVFNAFNGQIVEMDLNGNEQMILNIQNASKFKNLRGFGVDNENYYFTDNEGFLLVYNKSFELVSKKMLPFKPDSFTMDKNLFYFYSRSENSVQIVKIQDNIVSITEKFDILGIGNKGLRVKGNELWVSDDEENLIHIYDLATKKLKFSIITPFIAPTDLIFIKDKVFVSYCGQVTMSSFESVSWQEEKPFLHELKYKILHDKELDCVLSNSFLVEFTYEEAISRLNSYDHYEQLTVYLALPEENIRQQILDIKPIGVPFTIVQKDGKKFAEYVVGKIDANSSGLIGYKVLLKLSSRKYVNIVGKTFSDYQYQNNDLARELEDYEGGLDMDNRYIRNFAGIQKPNQIIEAVRILRNKVFEKLFYKGNSDAHDLEEVLRDGYGTCGDYSSIIMAVCKLNGIPIRSIGGFKVPRFTNSQYEQLSYYYNHAWLEFYYPEVGWLPFESSSDDKEFNGRLCEGQFLGEDWSHITTHKNRAIPNFIHCTDKDRETHPFDIFSSNIYFRVLGEMEI